MWDGPGIQLTQEEWVRVMELGVTTQTHLADPLPSVGDAEQLEAVNFSAETDAAGKEMPKNSAARG